MVRLERGGDVSQSDGVLDHLVGALAIGDRDEALACFMPGAIVVVSGSHHDYLSYPPVTVVDGLLRRFMEVTWEPHSRRLAGGALVVEGELGATHIGPFLGVDPSGARVTVRVRTSATFGSDGRVASLSVWGSRDEVLARLRAATHHPGSDEPEAGKPAREPGWWRPRRWWRGRWRWLAAAAAAVVLAGAVVASAQRSPVPEGEHPGAVADASVAGAIAGLGSGGDPLSALVAGRSGGQPARP